MQFVLRGQSCGVLWMFEKDILRHPLFLVGLVIKICLIFIFLPQAANVWYVPFLDESVVNFSLDPWTSYLSSGGSYLAFPYGYAMWITFLPMVLIAKFIGFPIYWGYAFTLLFADMLILFVLGKLMKVSIRTRMLLYWCSPIILFGSYWLGLNDLVPVTFLCLSVMLLRSGMPKYAGVLFGCAISAKISMIAVLPVFVFYLWRNKANNIYALPFVKGFVLSSLLLFTPFIFSESARLMLFQNPEIQKIYGLSVNLGGGQTVYVLGVAYVFMLYVIWKLGKLGFGLFIATLATTLFLFLLLTPAAPGWFLWVVPFLVYLQVQGGRKTVELVTAFSFAYVLVVFFFSPLPKAHYVPLNFLHLIQQSLGEQPRGILVTLLISFGSVLCVRFWKEAVNNNDIFGLSRRPIVIGIAGDSGAGKDTLADSLTGLFGHHSVVSVSGDDYHHWDRNRPMWQVMTHLNPQANDLENMSDDVLSLSCRKSIMARHYDHGQGVKGKPYHLKANDIVMVSGLHALYISSMRACYDVSIYLDIDEELRKYFKLKRDVEIRGHSREKVLSSIERREPDSCRFIRPQRDYADIVFSLKPVRPLNIDTLCEDNIRTKLEVKIRCNGFESTLQRVLIGICGMHVDMDITSDQSFVTMCIDGDVWADDIAVAAYHVMPNLEEILSLNPVWEGGVKGLMQLFVLSTLYQSRVKNLQYGK